MNLTPTEKAQLEDINRYINAIGNITTSVVTLSETKDELDLEDLKPSGRLSTLAQRITQNTPISDQDFATLVEACGVSIEKESRLNGVLLNIAAVANLVRTTVLPLIKTAII